MRTLSSLTPITSQRPLALLASLALSALVVGVQPASAQELTTSVTNTEAGTVDEQEILRTFNFNASSFPAGHNVITDVNISVDFTKLVDPNLDYAFFDEIRLTLTNPNGVSAVLVDAANTFDIGTEGYSFSGFIIFDDSATQPVNVNRNEPQQGTFRPAEPLSVFNGLAYAPGNWTLAIEDTVTGAPLTFNEATLSLTVVPEPATNALLLGGALVGGAVAWRRRRSRAVSPV